MPAAQRRLDRLKEWARRIKGDVYALYLAAGDSRVPWYAKLVAVGVAAYALSPIDLIPDFIPVLGYLDELVILPIGILLAVKLVPPALMAEFRATADRADRPRALGKWGAGFVLLLWLLGVLLAVMWARSLFAHSTT